MKEQNKLPRTLQTHRESNPIFDSSVHDKDN